ncbi:Cochaperone prefoldin complex subunit [Malassezia cuniculi]|uniref:Cochaperone prefoldin complex subunit n=1 Tax=Malassezia cuniculi TaxID=948313 RepID=A0AAF0EW29_9BASI|nr:Cochaperone prefoldin complex subunit [Malassezia cuniculi]
MAPTTPSEQQELAARIQQRRAELQVLAEKIGEIEADADEHRYVVADSLVIKSLAKVRESEPDRTCFRLVGGVLVERTVKDVLPTLEANFDGLAQVITQLAKQYKTKEAEMREMYSRLQESSA